MGGHKHKHDLIQTILACNSSRVASDVKSKLQDKHIMYDKKAINEGINWYNNEYFNEGKSFDELPEEKRNNISFLKGIEIAANSRIASQEAYDKGIQKRIDGFKFKELTEIQRNNKYFMQGFNDAREQALIDGVDWSDFPDEDDMDMFKQGKNWYKDGFSIDDAPDMMRYNSYFINGFEKEQSDYDLGMQKFIEDVNLKEYSEQHRASQSFIQGYRDAYHQSLIDGINWKDSLNNSELEQDTSRRGKGRR